MDNGRNIYLIEKANWYSVTKLTNYAALYKHTLISIFLWSALAAVDSSCGHLRSCTRFPDYELNRCPLSAKRELNTELIDHPLHTVPNQNNLG